jgi:mono/diheme cytochrome c family protein
MALGKLHSWVVAKAALILGVLGAGLAAFHADAQTSRVDFDWRAIGAQTFKTHCSACHQESGQGVAGAFPPLTGHVPEFFAQKSGRDYLVRVALFGLEGAIVVSGTTFDGAMPPWAQLQDAEIAAVLDHVLTSWGNDKGLPADFTPILPADVAVARAPPMSVAQVYALRQQIVPGQQSDITNSKSAQQAPVSFTAEQAERGKAAYEHNCQDCHGSTLDNGEFGGAPLKGSYFRQHWAAGDVAALYSFTATKMPPDRPGQLSPQTYLDLTAYILSHNGYPPGDRELPPDLDGQQKMTLKK